MTKYKLKFDELVVKTKKSHLEFNYWIKQKIDIDQIFNIVDVDGNNLLIHMIVNNIQLCNQDILDIMKANPNLVLRENKDGLNGLIYSAIYNKIDFLYQLKMIGFDLDHHTIFKYTPIMFASGEGNIELVRYLIKNNINIDNQDNNGHTALIRAVYNNHIDVVDELLNSGANSKIHNDYGFTALSLASKKGHEKIVYLLIDHNANIEVKTKGKSPILLSAEYGHINILTKLIEVHKRRNFSLNIIDENNASCLMWASYNGHINCVQILVEAGAEVNHRDNDGNNAILWATYKNHLEIVKLLIYYNADINSKNKNNDYPIFFAIDNNLMDIAAILLKSGIDISLKNKNNQTIFDVARDNIYFQKLINNFLVTADIDSEQLDKRLIDLRNKLLKYELIELVKFVKNSIDEKLSKDDFKEKIFTQIRSNIFSKIDEDDHKIPIDTALNDLYDESIGKDLKQDIDKSTNLITKFFRNIYSIIANTYRTRIISKIVEDIKILVILNVHNNVTKSFAKTVNDRNNIQQSVPKFIKTNKFRGR